MPQELYRGYSWIGALPFFSVAVPSKEAYVPRLINAIQHSTHYTYKQLTLEVPQYLQSHSPVTQTNDKKISFHTLQAKTFTCLLFEDSNVYNSCHKLP